MKPASGRDVSVVIPVYRNADTVKPLYERLTAVLRAQKLDYEIIFVNDACPANSFQTLIELSGRDARVVVLGLSGNVGQHAAVIVGLAQTRGIWTVIMDADLQDPPEAIPLLLEPAMGGVPVVFAGRRGPYESRARLFTSWWFKRILHYIARVPPDAGMYVVIHRNVVDGILKLRTAHPFVVAMIGCTGASSVSVPVPRDKRRAGQSAYTFWGRLRTGFQAIACVVECRWRPSKLTLIEVLGPGIVADRRGHKA